MSSALRTTGRAVHRPRDRRPRHGYAVGALLRSSGMSEAEPPPMVRATPGYPGRSRRACAARLWSCPPGGRASATESPAALASTRRRLRRSSTHVAASLRRRSMRSPRSSTCSRTNRAFDARWTLVRAIASRDEVRDALCLRSRLVAPNESPVATRTAVGSRPNTARTCSTPRRRDRRGIGALAAGATRLLTNERVIGCRR